MQDLNHIKHLFQPQKYKMRNKITHTHEWEKKSQKNREIKLHATEQPNGD